MNVLMTIAEMGSGGAEAVVEELARALPAHGTRVSVASAGGRRVAALHEAGIQAHSLPLPGRSPVGVLRTAAALRRVVRATAPDVVHAHNVGATLVARLALRGVRYRPPVLTSFHGVAEGDYARAASVLDRCSDAVVAVHDSVAERLREAGLRRVRLSVVPNAVRAPAASDRALARRRLLLAPDATVAVCAARLVPQKRHDVLLDAWSRLPGDSVLLLAGTGPLASAVADEITRRGLQQRVRLLGEHDDVPLLLSAADAFVLSSDWEGLPIALLEAMYAGLPIVATDVDGVGEALGDQAGLLVPPADPAALAAALDAVLGDQARRAAMASAARARAQRWSLPAMVEGYLEAYAELLPNRTAPRSVTT